MHDAERELLSELRRRETWLKFRDFISTTYFSTTDARKVRGVIARLHEHGKREVLPLSWIKRELRRDPKLDEPMPSSASEDWVLRTLVNSKTIQWQEWLQEQIEEGGTLDLSPMRKDLLDYERRIGGQASTNGAKPLLAADVLRKKDWKKVERTPTFLHSGLDDYLDGGMGPGQLAVLQAPPKNGKSSFLYTIAYRSARHGIPTYLFSCENYLDQIGERLEQIHRAHKGKRFPQNLWMDYRYQPALSDLEYLIGQLDEIGMIVIDYADNMRAIRTDGPDFVWTIDELYDGIRHLARERKATAWTATQATDPPHPWFRKSTRKQTYGSDKKIQKCDFFLGIQAHPQDDTATLTVLGRRGKGKVGEDFECFFDMDTCEITELG